MTKTCTFEGCNNPIFSRKTMRCKFHQPKRKTLAKTSIKNVSNKQQKSNREVSKAKATMLKEVLDEYGYLFCKGCGTTQGRIDCSHIIPISDNKKLEGERLNLTLHCEKCHNIFEHKLEGLKEMNDLQHNLEVMEKLDNNYFTIFVNKYIL